MSVSRSRMSVVGVEHGGSIMAPRTAGIGASRPLRRIPAIVSFLNPQPALSLGGENRSSCPKGDLRLASGRKSEGLRLGPGAILGLAIMPEARPGLVHRRLPAATDPQRLAVLIRHRPGIAGHAGIGARRVELEQILEPAAEPDPDQWTMRIIASAISPLSEPMLVRLWITGDGEANHRRLAARILKIDGHA
jgi:hypothetical protein